MSLEARRRALCYALQHVGAPYCWRAKGRVIWTPQGLVPHQWGDCFDCSGLVTSAFRFGTGIDWRGTHSAQTLWETLLRTDEPMAGDLALYGDGTRATHVMLHVWGGMVVGAVGGDEEVSTPVMSAARSKATGLPCGVHVYCEHSYDKRFMGWRALPFPEEEHYV